MAKILLITSGIASVYLQNLELARRLQKMGHEVGYASQDSIGQIVKRFDLPFIQLNGEAPHKEKIYYRAGNSLSKVLQLIGKLFTVRSRRRKAIADLEIAHFRKQVENFDPDLFVIDIELHAHIIAAYSFGKPILLSSIWLSLFEMPDVPPLHLYKMPGPDSTLAWKQFRRWKKRHLLSQFLRTVGEDPFTLLRSLGRQEGFPINEEIEAWQWLLPFSYQSLPVMSLSSIKLDFPREPAQQEFHVGPMLLRNRKESLFPADRIRLETLLTQRRKDERKLVYCAFGAQFQGSDKLFFQNVVQAASNLSQYDFVIGLGNRLQPSDFPSVGPNIHLFNWVPQLQVLEVADAAIVHAGISTLNECIYHGVPMLMYPFWGVVDQSGNAARIEFHKLGFSADRDVDTPVDIARRLNQLLADTSVQASIKKMQSQFLRDERENKLEKLVTKLLATTGA